MTCISPNISAVVGRINRTEVGLGFIVNNVQRLYVLENITVRQDPEFKAFIGVRTLKTTDLILEVGILFSAIASFETMPEFNFCFLFGGQLFSKNKLFLSLCLLDICPRGSLLN